MCIIAAIPQGQQITKGTLKRCWENNPHGGGFMYSDGNKVIVHKEMVSFKRYWKAFHEAKTTYTNSSFVCHFRISTHGKINETNCHPFLVNKNLGFAHNGIIYNAPRSDNFSDTYMFNETILKMIPNNFLNNTAMIAMIKEYIGNGSKLAFLNTKHEITIINESAGVWDDGVWYSNSGYKATKYFDYGGTKVGSVYATPSYPYAKKTSTIAPSLFDSKTKDIPDTCKSCDVDDDVNVYSSDWNVDYYGNPRKGSPKCDYCGEQLVTSSERINDCCNTCMNDILEADRLNAKNRNKLY